MTITSTITKARLKRDPLTEKTEGQKGSDISSSQRLRSAKAVMSVIFQKIQERISIVRVKEVEITIL